VTTRTVLDFLRKHEPQMREGHSVHPTELFQRGGWGAVPKTPGTVLWDVPIGLTVATTDSHLTLYGRNRTRSLAINLELDGIGRHEIACHERARAAGRGARQQRNHPFSRVRRPDLRVFLRRGRTGGPLSPNPPERNCGCGAARLLYECLACWRLGTKVGGAPYPLRVSPPGVSV